MSFISKAKECGAIGGGKFSQKQWLLGKAKMRGLKDSFGMDKGTCWPISLEFLACAKNGWLEYFGLHMSVPAVHDTMQQLKISQEKGTLVSKEYLGQQGLVFVGKKKYSGAPAIEMQADLSERSGYYSIGFDGVACGHQIAAVIGQECYIFDPNYGYAKFSNAEAAATFLFVLISEYYSNFKVGGDMERYA